MKNAPSFELVVDLFSRLPGIGPKTAKMIAKSMFDNPQLNLLIIKALSDLKDVGFCQSCFSIIEKGMKYCEICSDEKRENIICIVAQYTDVDLIESTRDYNGTYYVLGGLISPEEGILGESFQLDVLSDRINKEHPVEIIFALETSLNADSTILYIRNYLSAYTGRFSRLARGLQIGSTLEFTDDETIRYSLAERQKV